MHKHLDGLEVCSIAGRFELADLRKIYRSAKLGQEKSRTTRMSLEQDVYRSKQVQGLIIIGKNWDFDKNWDVIWAFD